MTRSNTSAPAGNGGRGANKTNSLTTLSQAVAPEQLLVVLDRLTGALERQAQAIELMMKAGAKAENLADPILSAAEAAEYARVQPRRIREACLKRELAHSRLGDRGAYKIRRSDLDRWISVQGVSPRRGF